jgi:undecaprenyl-diphosphatase
MTESGASSPRLLPLACSCAALVVVFWGLFRLDIPIAKSIRFLEHDQYDHLRVPWLDFISVAGDWLGGGWRLVYVSAALLAVGWAMAAPTIRRAGWETLIAHAVVSLIANGLKHVVGRPRPKFVHSDRWQFFPSWSSGWDSFPSGHSSASFAVATVLSEHFPRGAPVIFAIATFIAMSRVLRGSHFLSDVAAGAVLGILCGTLVAHPLREWRTSLHHGIARATPACVACFALLWTLFHPAITGWQKAVVLGIGIMAIVVGVWSRGIHRFGVVKTHWGLGLKEASVSMAMGLAVTTGSMVVVGAVGLACLGYGFGSWPGRVNIERAAGASELYQGAVREGILLMGVVLTLVVIWKGQGVFTIR